MEKHLVEAMSAAQQEGHHLAQHWITSIVVYVDVKQPNKQTNKQKIS